MIVGKMKKQSNVDKSAEPYMILGSLQTHAVRTLIDGGGYAPCIGTTDFGLPRIIEVYNNWSDMEE